MSMHTIRTYCRWSDFEEWILEGKYRCSYQQCWYILHSHRDQYPAGIHWYLEGWNQHVTAPQNSSNILQTNYKKQTNKQTNKKTKNKYTIDCCITCAVESISLIASLTAAVVTSNGITAISILITVVKTIQLTLINIWMEQNGLAYSNTGP